MSKQREYFFLYQLTVSLQQGIQCSIAMIAGQYIKLRKYYSGLIVLRAPTLAEQTSKAYVNQHTRSALPFAVSIIWNALCEHLVARAKK